MAMTATIAVNPSTVNINQNVAVALTVSNSGGSPVNMTGIVPTAFFTGAPAIDKAAGGAALGQPQLGQSGANVTVPAGGSLVFNWNVVFFAPSTRPVYSGSGGTYDVGAICYSNDGSVFSPTAATVTVNPLPLPDEQGG